MSLNARENINGVTPQDLNKMNNNFMSIWKALFGGLDFSDTNSALKKRIQTQQMPVQGEGNFDVNFPLYVRFFVPSNTKSITSTSFNLICERYRMDSGVAMGGGGVLNAPIQMALSNANTGVASVSSPTVGVSSVGGGGTTSSSSPAQSAYVDYWGNWNPTDPNASGDVVAVPATFMLYNTMNSTGDNAGDFPISGYPPYGSATGIYDNIHSWFAAVYQDSRARMWLDLASVQHKHILPTHRHDIPSHSHTISMEPHTHTITLQPHTHNATASITLPDHVHNLNEGIKISSQNADNVVVKLNGNIIANMDSSANSTKNNIDAKDNIKIGEWNVLECTTSNLARITIYGIIELVMNY